MPTVPFYADDGTPLAPGSAEDLARRYRLTGPDAGTLLTPPRTLPSYDVRTSAYRRAVMQAESDTIEAMLSRDRALMAKAREETAANPPDALNGERMAQVGSTPMPKPVKPRYDLEVVLGAPFTLPLVAGQLAGANDRQLEGLDQISQGLYGAAAATVGTKPSAGEKSSRLYHYTNKAGLEGILDSGQLNPSLKALNPNDVRYGNGQYLSDIAPGTMTPAQLSRQFINNPFQGARYTHFLEIDTSGLNIVQGRPGVFVVPNEAALDLTGRITGSGRVITTP